MSTVLLVKSVSAARGYCESTIYFEGEGEECLVY